MNIVRTQTTDHIVMVRPKHFGYNPETAGSNAFQNKPDADQQEEVSKAALEEFDNAVGLLMNRRVRVTVIEDADLHKLPDAIFPNNWFTTHQEGYFCTYPMYAPIRRLERRQSMIHRIVEDGGYRCHIDFTLREDQELYLEGTGVLILDRVHKLAYACRSPRSNPILFQDFCSLLGYQGFLFDSVDEKGQPIYHTNVMMAMGTEEVVICLDSIPNGAQKDEVLRSFERTNKTVVDITPEQVRQYAGNMLQLQSEDGSILWVMSAAAYASLDAHQRALLSSHSDIVSIPIPTIERVGGGSIRCMMAEIFACR